jgi:hypothetical protein
MMIVWPCSATRARSSRSTSREVPVSSAPVGSSANSTRGPVTSARAIATRCCWPPDSSLGRCLARSARPTADSAASIASGSGLRPASRNGSSTFCAALSDGIRLKDWKMNPICSRRSTVSAVSPRRPSRVPLMLTSPESGRSSPAAHCSRVDLPEPDGPITAVKEPAGKVSVTRSRAVTVPGPFP